MKKILCLLLVLTTIQLSAQNAMVRQHMLQTASSRNITDIPSSNIQFWVGQGSNEVVAAFFACGPSSPGGVAYGFRYNNTATIQEMLDSIAAADPNFSINYSSGFINSISYNNGTLQYNITGGMLTYTVNSVWASGLSDLLSNGAYFELTEWGDCTLPNTNIYYPEDPNTPTIPEDATIEADDLVYWVGNGENHAIVAVNWCDTAIALAWGVRFTGDSALVADLMHTIALYDDRFSYQSASGAITNIIFQDGTYNLSLQGSWWMYNINGVGAMNGFESQYVYSGDLVKWGDELCGNSDESYNYTWSTPIMAAAIPAQSSATFDGIVGTTDCQAISYDNSAILNWATGCTITRGYQNIAEPSLGFASYGDESYGIGTSSTSTTDAVSLGDGGTAVLTFSQAIVNGEGYDFAVFENSLNDSFLELAFVEVSSDGIHYYRFPSLSNTSTDEQIGNAGSVDATQLYNLAGKYRAGWGTAFDLAELDGYSNLDINNVTHIRLVDVVGSIDSAWGTTDKNGHLINDPYPTAFVSGGFDLTGVAVLNGWTPSDVEIYQAEHAIMVYPNPCTQYCVISNLEVGSNVQLLNATGQLIWNACANDTSIRIDLQTFPTGLYFINAGQQTSKIMKR